MRNWLIFSVLWILTSSAAWGYVYSDYTWHTYNGHEYAATFAVGPWLEVENKALAIGGHLVNINNEVENIWLTVQFDNISDTTLSSSHAAWIGFYETTGTWDKINGTWVWVCGDPVTYTNISGLWADPGPHMYMTTASYEDPDPDEVGRWNNNIWHDERPTHYMHGIIEIPEPTTLLLFGLGGLVLRKRKY